MEPDPDGNRAHHELAEGERRHVTEEEVIELYDALCANGVAIWIDGGWCVDALLGAQTREHLDFDIAVRRGDEPATRAALLARGFANAAGDERTDWDYVMKDTSKTTSLASGGMSPWRRQGHRRTTQRDVMGLGFEIHALSRLSVF